MMERKECRKVGTLVRFNELFLNKVKSMGSPFGCLGLWFCVVGVAMCCNHCFMNRLDDEGPSRCCLFKANQSCEISMLCA